MIYPNNKCFSTVVQMDTLSVHTQLRYHYIVQLNIIFYRQNEREDVDLLICFPLLLNTNK